MIAVITSVLAGATAGLLAAVVSDHSLAASLATGCLFALGTLAARMRFQSAAWKRAEQLAETVVDEGAAH